MTREGSHSFHTEKTMKTDFAEPEIIAQDEDAVAVSAPSLGTLMQVSEAEVNRQIMQAMAYPRTLDKFRKDLQAMVCYDEETAISCMYSLKRDGKQIVGPSVRFAEAAFQCWGNARCGSRIVDIGDEFVTAQGFYWDLEKNTGLAFEVLNRITTREGKRYGDDMIMTAGNAAGSKAVRNAIHKGIPKTAWNPIFKLAMNLAVGKGESISLKRDNMVKAFAPLNVDKAQILGLIGVRSLDEVSIDDLVFMFGVLNSIRDGEQTVEKVFSLDNMSNPDQVKPAAPRRNDFAGTDKKQPTKTQEKAETKEDEKPKDPDDAKPDQGEDDRIDLVKDLYKELEAARRIRDVPDICERGIDAGILTDAEETAWRQACKDRSDAILDAAKKKPG